MARRWMGVTDCTRHMGMPVTTACVILAVITTITNCYVLFFLPVVAGFVLLGLAGVIGLAGIVAAIAKLRILINLYLIFETLMRIPVGVVMGFTIYTLINWGDCWHYAYGAVCYYNFSDYQRSLFALDLGFVWSALIVGFISCILSGMALGGFRKLRMFAAGVHRVERVEPHHHHHHEHVVIAQPCYPAQPTVYTTGVPYTGQQPTVMMQQPQQPMYPQINQQPAYPQPPAYPQQTNLDPPAHNPDHQ